MERRLVLWLILHIVVPAAFAVWIVYAVLESRKRRGFSPEAFEDHGLHSAELVFLITFFHVGEWSKPLVLKVPTWCRVNQVIKWDTSKPDEKYGGTRVTFLFLLVVGTLRSTTSLRDT